VAKKLYMFVTGEDGRSRELPVDPANVERQAREHRAAGREVTILDEDERIRFGRLAQQIAADHRAGRI
jgi:hypothetical protein